MILRGDCSILAVRLRDPATGLVRSYLPGGAVEPGESPETAAIRETLEETGYTVKLDHASAREHRYLFVWGGAPVDCLTTFFRGELSDPDATPQAVDDASYHCGVIWVPIEAAAAEFGFHAEIFAAITEQLGAHHE